MHPRTVPYIFKPLIPTSFAIQSSYESWEKRKKKLGEIPKKIFWLRDEYNSILHISRFRVHTMTMKNNWRHLKRFAYFCSKNSLYYYGNFLKGKFLFSSACFAYRFLFCSIAIYRALFLCYCIHKCTSHPGGHVIQTLSLWCKFTFVNFETGVDLLLCRLFRI